MQAEPVAVVVARAVALAAVPVAAQAAAPAAAVTNRFFQADGCTPLKKKGLGIPGPFA
jgi:hypothetical protein